MRDQMNELHFKRAISPVSSADSTALTGEVIDLQGYAACTFVIATGSIGDADATFAVEVQECDTSGGSYTAVADANLIGTEALAGFIFSDDNKCFKVGYQGSKRYVKIVITPTGNSGTPSAALLAAVAVLGHPNRAPTSNPPA